MKKTAKILVSLLLVVCLALTFVLVACNDDETPKGEENALATSLKVAIKNYIASDAFAEAKLKATTQDRVPIIYSRYLDANVYTESDANTFKTNLGLIDSVIQDNALSDALYDADDCPLYTKSSYTYNGVVYESKNGWQSIVDYVYSWSLMYNQYKQYLSKNGQSDTSYDKYVQIIKNYLSKVDSSATYYGTAYGYDKATSAVLTLANLGIDAKEGAPTSYDFVLSYYDKNDEDEYYKYLGNPNWIGFSGRPLAAGSLMRAEEKYSLTYEKTMQGIYPYDDSKTDANYNYNINDMINLDRLYDDYGKEIISDYDSLGDSRYGILYGYINSIDMSAYVKTTDNSTKYDIIGKWIATLTVDENGNYVLADSVDMAVAIAYVAYSQGVTAPTPVGAFTASVPCIEL